MTTERLGRGGAALLGDLVEVQNDIAIAATQGILTSLH